MGLHYYQRNNYSYSGGHHRHPHYNGLCMPGGRSYWSEQYRNDCGYGRAPYSPYNPYNRAGIGYAPYTPYNPYNPTGMSYAPYTPYNPGDSTYYDRLQMYHDHNRVSSGWKWGALAGAGAFATYLATRVFRRNDRDRNDQNDVEVRQANDWESRLRTI